MCKTVLLHCVSNTRTNFWKENSLLPCLTFCLSTLYHCVLNEYCPHYMIPENNLMYGRFPQDTKRFLLETISYVVKSNGHALLEIKSDQLGIRIQNSFLEGVEKCSEHLAAQISGCILRNTVMFISDINMFWLLTTTYFGDVHTLSQYLLKLLQWYNWSQEKGKTVCSSLVKLFCVTLGSVLASTSLYS